MALAMTGAERKEGRKRPSGCPLKRLGSRAPEAKEAGVSAIVNTSQMTSRRDSKSHAAQNHWIGERVFDWCGVPVHRTVFSEEVRIFRTGRLLMVLGLFLLPAVEGAEIYRYIAPHVME